MKKLMNALYGDPIMKSEFIISIKDLKNKKASRVNGHNVPSKKKDINEIRVIRRTFASTTLLCYQKRMKSIHEQTQKR